LHLAADANVQTSDGVVLLEWNRPPYEGRWVLPGGTVERDEAAREAAVRETREEIGVAVEGTDVVGRCEDPDRDSRGTVSAAYRRRRADPTGRPEAREEACRVASFPVDDRPTMGVDHETIAGDDLASDADTPCQGTTAVSATRRDLSVSCVSTPTMTQYTRRRALRYAAGLAVASTVAGCLGDDDSGSDGTSTDGTTTAPPTAGTSTTPPSGSVATHAWNGAPELHPGDAPFPEGDVGSYYLALLTDGDHAASFGFQGDAAGFLVDTDFETASVVLLQDRRGQSTPDLAVSDVRHVDGSGVRLTARYPGTVSTGDIITDTVAVRVPNDGTTPDWATVDVAGRTGATTTFSTTSKYGADRYADPGAVVVQNRDCRAHRVSVTATRNGELFYASSHELAPASATTVPDVLTHPGDWQLSVTRHGPDGPVTKSWSLGSDAPGDVLGSVAGDGSLGLAYYPDGVTDAEPSTCETDGDTYESTDPSENVADPVDLWLVSQDDDERTLDVTIVDQATGTEVYSETYVLAAGKDKQRRQDLVAKRGTYAVTVTPDAGDPVETTLGVAADVGKFTVHVDDDGTISVLAN
jgi:8-oxo-dGTP diphosphatase